MRGTKQRNFKWIVDLCMTLVLLCLMAYQVCGEVLHEWGGVLMTLADTAMGAACLELGKKVVTIQLSTEFMHSVPLTERIIARAKVLHDGRRTMACECEMLSREGKLFAKAQGTFYVLGLLEEG